MRVLLKKYFVYIVKCSDDSYYTGVTNDVFLRETQHNQGLDPKSYTFKRRPVMLVWYQEFENPKEAINKEKQLKGWSRKKKEALITGNLELLPKLSRNSLRRAQTDGKWNSNLSSSLRQAQTDSKRDSNLSSSLRRAQTDNYSRILKKLPYTKPFLFVDKINTVSKSGLVGEYTFNATEDFYKGHFKDFPVTPGVILTECCAQIGLVCLGIYLLGGEVGTQTKIGLSSSEMEFLAPVFPNEKVTVHSELVYFRFHKLKCKVKMYDSKENLVCKGVISGMFKVAENEE
ncbi:GIY-YIG nuclease family protein [uncultured Croceitalea sp.]|uniref:GIY-YIG nuclease family protein n=1 Tax=uncultured Croceitalea sp. TaxID=1798908 RepID=UPI003305A6DC